MWILARRIIPFGIIYIIGTFYLVFIISTASVYADSNCRPKACSRSISNEKAMCGSDGLSYPNRCQFERARCQNKSLSLIRRGACKQQRPCTEWTQINQTAFLPSCRTDDGTYESTQCHLDTGFCWCVTPKGVPLPYTTVRRKPDGKTKCGRRKTKRRSPNKKHRNRSCKQPDKAIFNNHLINVFHTEYNRENGIYHAFNNITDTVVTSWKFSVLDVNHDNVLDKTEYRDLRRVVKKALRPKRCARNFIRTCDVNGDQRINRPEWVECLTRDGMGDGHSGGGGGGADGGPNSSSDFSTSHDEDDDTEDHFISPPHGVLSSETGSVSTIDDDESQEVHEDDPTDCLSDRRAAMAEGYNLYVPECTTDGRYQKVQCYNSAGYCWCVNEDSGKNIPGTSVKDAIPKCDQLKTSNKTMKGCPDDKKAIFLRDLLEYMHTKMSTGNSLRGMPWLTSKDEQAATWSFVFFDKNQNKKLERSEWKAFKDMVAGVKGLRKCGKKLPRYCDNNRDRQISMTEWLECLNIQNGSAGSVASTPANKRAGKQNPLSMLIED